MTSTTKHSFRRSGQKKTSSSDSEDLQWFEVWARHEYLREQDKLINTEQRQCCKDFEKRLDNMDRRFDYIDHMLIEGTEFVLNIEHRVR
jgi:hypothetical protein